MNTKTVGRTLGRTIKENWLGLLLVTLSLAGMASFAEGSTIGGLEIPAPLVGTLFILAALVCVIFLLPVTKQR